MKQLKLFIVPAIFFLTVLHSNAQVTKTLNGTVRYESGISETKFSTQNGDVVMKLPQSLSGTVINGTVSAEPAGRTEKEKNKNLKELLKYVVMLDGQKIPLSANPSSFDWLTHPDRNLRTPMELLNVSGVKVGEASLPSVLSTPAANNSGKAPRLSTPSNVLVKGDALNIYTDQQFSPGEKFILTDSKGQQFTMSPVCLSSQQAVMSIPDEAATGNYTVKEQTTNKPGSDMDNPPWTMMRIDLSSPNTNLRPGQGSFVMAKCSFNDAYGKFVSIDLCNLDPNIVTMEGGNIQRVNADCHYGDSDLTGPIIRDFCVFQIRRNITGNAVGSFSVSATLHEDYNTSNDPFRPQLNVLKTPEDFNTWANAVTEDLSGYTVPGRFWGDINVIPPGFEKKVQRVIDNMPVCTSPEQLDECKAVAYSLLQPLHVPKGAAISWLSSYEATKAAAKAIDNTLAGITELIDYDVLKNGTEFINRVGGQLKDASLQTQCNNIQQLIDDIQTGAETKENLQDLKNKMNALTAKTDMKIKTDEEIIIKTGMKDLIMSSYQLPSFARPGEVHPFNDLIGFLDPRKEVLMAVPEYQQKALNQFNAVKQPDGKYYLQTDDLNGKPVGMNVSLALMSQLDIFLDAKSDEKTLEDYVDSLNTIARNDTARASFFIKKEGVFKLWTRIFKNAKCVEVDPAYDSPCQGDDLRDGKFIIYHYAAEKHCKKGFVECKERLVWLVSVDLYTEAGCKGKNTLSIRALDWPYFSCE